MKYLLDTHTLIWFLNGDKELSSKARKAIESNNVVNFVSIASLWEIAIKISLKKLELNVSFKVVNRLLEENGFLILPISPEDTVFISTLPFFHRDPFDRILIAQSINNDLTVITKDVSFEDYKTKTIW